MSDLDNAVGILLGDIIAGKEEVENRVSLGGKVPIRLFQALRLVGMGTSINEMVGDGANAMVYRSGQDLGMALGGALAPKADGNLDNYVDLVAGACKHLSIGVVHVEKVDLDNGELSIRVDECVSCAGISGVQKPICNFEAGLVGGIVRAFVKVPVKAVETRCNAVGDSTCGIDLTILG